jgi:hypothetical protein
MKEKEKTSLDHLTDFTKLSSFIRPKWLDGAIKSVATRNWDAFDSAVSIATDRDAYIISKQPDEYNYLKFLKELLSNIYIEENFRTGMKDGKYVSTRGFIALFRRVINDMKRVQPIEQVKKFHDSYHRYCILPKITL